MSGNTERSPAYQALEFTQHRLSPLTLSAEDLWEVRFCDLLFKAGAKVHSLTSEAALARLSSAMRDCLVAFVIVARGDGQYVSTPSMQGDQVSSPHILWTITLVPAATSMYQYTTLMASCSVPHLELGGQGRTM